jgi:methylphosphotriester-DNA--protein-cysteine methyltransferase
MRYLEFTPKPRLRRYVECYWHLQSAQQPWLLTPERILPDGCVELILNLADRFKRFHVTGEVEVQPPTLIAGQMRTYALIQPLGQVKLWGIRFRPAGAFAFLHVPLQQLTDQIIDGEVVLARWATELQERLALAHSVRTSLKLIEAALWQRQHERWQCDRLVEEAVRRIAATEGRVQVERLFMDLGLSGRQIERKFQSMVGFSPKTLARIFRFQKIFKSAGTAADSWSAVAVDCGYYDQAHLIHDFQQFAGQSPSSFLLAQTEMSAFFTRKNRMSIFYNTKS